MWCIFIALWRCKFIRKIHTWAVLDCLAVRLLWIALFFHGTTVSVGTDICFAFGKKRLMFAVVIIMSQWQTETDLWDLDNGTELESCNDVKLAVVCVLAKPWRCGTWCNMVIFPSVGPTVKFKLRFMKTISRQGWLCGLKWHFKCSSGRSDSENRVEYWNINNSYPFYKSWVQRWAMYVFVRTFWASQF